MSGDNYNNFRIAVPEDFEEVFSHFYFAENKSGETITKTLLPTFQTILVFNFGANALLYSQKNTQIKINKCIILGPIKHGFDYALPLNSEILVANFKDDAFYRFFGETSVAEHLPMNPDALLQDNCFITLWNDLNKIKDTNSRVHHLLEFCKPYLRNRTTIAKQLAGFADGTLNPVKTVAKDNSQTERNIQLYHKKYFGYSSRELGRYQRFLRAIHLIQNIATDSSKIDWFEIISECGYYDQSQLIKDFRHYIKLSPTKYLKFQQDICNAKS